MIRLRNLIRLVSWRAAFACLLAWLAGPALAAGGCSPYVGQVVINEVRIGASKAISKLNQIELLNSAGVSVAVWQTWKLVVWGGDSQARAVLKGTHPMSTGFTATGPFIFNNVTAIHARNGAPNGAKEGPRASDFAVFDANDDLVAYLAIGVGPQTVPACYGPKTTIPATAGSDNTGTAMRATDGGAWPAIVPRTQVHTIGRTNVCSTGGDLIINSSVDYAKPVRADTTVTFTVTIYNNSCGTNVSGNKVTITNLSTANFSDGVITVDGGSITETTSHILWNVGTVNAGVIRTFTFTGKAINLGALTSVATLTAPSTGLVNTGDDSDSAAITVSEFNYVGFEEASATVREDTDLSYAAVITLYAPTTATTTVNYSVGGSAGPGDTNLGSAGSIVIPSGSIEAPISFNVTNDAIHEPTKNIILTITSVTSSNALVKIGTAPTGDILTETITLEDDDPLRVDHYQLTLASSGLACSASTATITACADSSSPCSNVATTISGATATLATAFGTLASTTLTFSASGVASTTLSWPAAADGASTTVTLAGESVPALSPRKCCANGTTCSVANSCSIAFKTAGFIISAITGGSAATLPTQTAGTSSGSYQLRAVQTNTTTKACEAALVGANSVNWAYQCIDPSTCSASNLMTLTGSSASVIARNPASGVSAYAAVPMTFDANGNAPFSFAFADVGQARLWASMVVGGAALAGSSNAFVTRPAGFSLSSIRQTAAPGGANPAAAGAAGAKFIKAGESFSATVAAVTAGGAVTPNFGRESSAEGVLLTPSLVLPAGGTAGTLANATLAGSLFSAGSATVTNLSYSEVGIITLTPSIGDGSYLGAGDVNAAGSGNIGRFVPAMFALGSPSVTHRSAQSCTPASAFTYLGENFRLVFSLTARNTAGATTRNYSGSFAKLDPTQASGWNLTGIAGATIFSVGSGRLSLGSSTGSWSNGVAGAVTITANAARSAAADGPFNASFGIAPVDSDGVAMDLHNLASIPSGSPDRSSLGSVALRFGRLRLSNAIGAQTRALALPLAAHYWNGAAFATNTLDSCTTIAPTAVSIGNLRKTLTAADMVVAGSTIRLASGSGLVTLAAPAGGRFGTADVALSLGPSAADASCLQGWTPTRAATTGANLGYLRSAWCANTPDKDPAARATFGLYGGSDSMLYQRENF